MIMIEQHLLACVFMIVLSRQTFVNAMAGRCYLCSQTTLAECAGSNELDSSMYKTVLQYYTEPCNGQCVLFRNENRLTIRGCSWTYGHMTAKPTGWHDISPGVKAYFCDSYLCNDGTYEEPSLSVTQTPVVQDKQIPLLQDLFLLFASNPSLGPMEPSLSQQLRQCYSCTGRFQGCSEVLDPHFASSYVRPCPSSCIIFRNPNDLNLITRDCAIFWPQVHGKSGVHKLLGSDAFFCQESLCNGISFDFIMGILYNRLPSITQLPSNETKRSSSLSTLTTYAPTKQTTVDIYNDNFIWDDDDLDEIPIEFLTSTTSKNFTRSSSTIKFVSTTPALRNLSNLNDSSQVESSMNSTLIPDMLEVDDDNNSTQISSVTRYEQLAMISENDEANEIDEDLDTIQTDLNADINVDLNDYDGLPISTTTASISDTIDAHNLFDLYNKTKEELFELIKQISTYDMPPFAWMLNMANEQKNQILNSTLTTNLSGVSSTNSTTEVYYEYCKNKQCYHGGRLNSDCLCICLPAFTGDYCETVLCDQEPVDICAFILDYECDTDYIQYLCPRFCEFDSCSSKI